MIIAALFGDSAVEGMLDLELCWRCLMKYPCLILSLMLLLAGSPVIAEQRLLIDDFENGLHASWQEKQFSGRTLYSVVPDGAGQVLRAESRGAASGLIFRKEFDPREYPFLTWRWKVANILEKGDATRKEGDDYAARVYVIFPHWFPPKTRSINYIWANRLPRGEFLPNTYFGNAMMLAVRSGPQETGRWVTERRDIVSDYRLLFGEEPSRVGAIAIMTDTDNTGETAIAWYDDLWLEKR
jgi:hypothetical protein